MTTKLDSAIWRDMMDYLRRRHAQICRQWFEELEPLDLNAGLLLVRTPTQIQQNYLQRRCRDQFVEAAQATTGRLLTVRFVTGEIDDKKIAQIQASVPEPVAVSVVETVPPSDNGSIEAHKRTSSVANHRQASNSHLDSSTYYSGQVAVGYNPSNPDHHVFDQTVIIPDYSFDSFVTGPGNQLAYAAAVAVANQPGTAYNPLFIHGGVGLGKTHLLQAICQSVIQKQPSMKITYLSCDAFMNQFLDCVQQGKMADFRHRYRHTDMLVIDDIHFLANRERTQEEFFHTFNELYHLNKQIVLSSDSPPNEIPQLEERLISRFGWGLVATVSRPCYETRVAIVKSKAKIRALDLSDDVVSYIASRIDTNARELEGAINTIQGHAALQNRSIDLKLAREALGEVNSGDGSGQIGLHHIIDAVTRFYNVKLSELQSKRRHKSITEPRQICMWLARKHTRFSLEEIGGHFGGRDHTTVIHSIRIVDDRSKQDDNLVQTLAKLEEQITAGRLPSTHRAD